MKAEFGNRCFQVITKLCNWAIIKLSIRQIYDVNETNTLYLLYRLKPRYENQKLINLCQCFSHKLIKSANLQTSGYACN